MNFIWVLMMLTSIVVLIITGPGSFLNAMISASTDALNLCIELCAVYAVWLGFMEIMDKSGLGQKLANALHPIIKWLFKVDNTEIEKMIALNVSANMLGLGNAATPMGIRAMEKMDDGSGIATPAMIMLVIVNATSIQLLPTTIMGLRTTAGSTSAADIILPTLLCTIITTIIGVTLAKLCEKACKKIKSRRSKR